MEAIQLHKETIDAVIESFLQRGLVIIPKDIAELASAKYLAKRKKLMHHTVKWVSAYDVAAFNLINSNPELNTIKNWVKNNTIGPNDYKYDTTGKIPTLMISKNAITELNK